MNQPEIANIIQQIKGKILEGWCKHFSAIDKSGFPVSVSEPTACKWCLLGAMSYVKHAMGVDFKSPSNAIIDNAIAEGVRKYTHYEHHDVVAFNDALNTKLHHVLAALDVAIKLQDEKEQPS